MTRRLAALLLGGMAAMALAAGVLAHASLVSSDPPAGGTLTTTPYTLTATFDEDLTPDGSSIVIEGPNGAEVTTGSVSPDDSMVMTADLPALAPGQYIVRWTAITADDLAVEHGTYTFSVGSVPTSATPVATQPPAGGATGSGDDVLIALVLAGALIAAVVAFIFIRGRR